MFLLTYELLDKKRFKMTRNRLKRHSLLIFCVFVVIFTLSLAGKLLIAAVCDYNFMLTRESERKLCVYNEWKMFCLSIFLATGRQYLEVYSIIIVRGCVYCLVVNTPL